MTNSLYSAGEALLTVDRVQRRRGESLSPGTKFKDTPINRPPTFKKWLPPLSIARPQRVFEPKERRDRNTDYDSRWDRLSIAFRRKHPFCAECTHNGHPIVPAAVTGHIIPARDRPELRLEWRNLRPLCTKCNAVMAVLEDFARKNGLTDELPKWCADPQTRPMKFRPPPRKRITNGSHGKALVQQSDS